MSENYKKSRDKQYCTITNMTTPYFEEQTNNYFVGTDVFNLIPVEAFR